MLFIVLGYERTLGNSAFPLGLSFQWELRSRCQKSKELSSRVFSLKLITVYQPPYLQTLAMPSLVMLSVSGRMYCISSV